MDKNLNSFPQWNRVRKFTTLAASFFGLELLIRILGFAAALSIVRGMPKEQYAFYALANNFQDTLTLFSSTGVGAALLAMGGPVVGNRRSMGEVASAASGQRIVLLAVGAPVAISIFGYLLLKNGCPMWQTLLMLFIALLMLSQAIGVQIAHFSFGLVGQYRVPQLAEAGGGVLRLLFILMLLAIGWLFPVPLQLANLLAISATFWLFSVPRARVHVEFGVKPPSELKERFGRIMWHSMPATFNAIFQGQIAMWLVALSGNSTSVADLGALTRLGLIMTIPSAFVGKVITPRLAAEQNPRRIFKIWIQTVLLGLFGGIVFFFLVVIFQDHLVTILGHQYSSLSQFMVLYAGYTSYQFAVMSAFSIIQAKGWLKNYWIAPAAIFLFQGIALFFLRVDNVQGAILFRWIGDLGGTIALIWLTFLGFRGKNKL